MTHTDLSVSLELTFLKLNACFTRRLYKFEVGLREVGITIFRRINPKNGLEHYTFRLSVFVFNEGFSI